MRNCVVAEHEGSYQAAVKDGVPHRWTALDSSLDVSGFLRLSHVTYIPPRSLDELSTFVQSRGLLPVTAMYSVRAIVRTLTASNSVEDYVIACFPLDVRRLSNPLTFRIPSPPKERCESDLKVLSDNGPSPEFTISSLLPGQGDATATRADTSVLPCATDIVTRLNVRFRLDGFTELRVEGPGTVVFSGEQRLSMVSRVRHVQIFS